MQALLVLYSAVGASQWGTNCEPSCKEPNAPAQVEIRHLYPPPAVDQQVGAFQVTVDHGGVMAAQYFGAKSVLTGARECCLISFQTCVIPDPLPKHLWRYNIPVAVSSICTATFENSSDSGSAICSLNQATAWQMNQQPAPSCHHAQATPPVKVRRHARLLPG